MKVSLGNKYRYFNPKITDPSWQNKTVKVVQVFRGQYVDVTVKNENGKYRTALSTDLYPL